LPLFALPHTAAQAEPNLAATEVQFGDGAAQFDAHGGTIQHRELEPASRKVNLDYKSAATEIGSAR
jgi:hypothetical protein